MQRAVYSPTTHIPGERTSTGTESPYIDWNVGPGSEDRPRGLGARQEADDVGAPAPRVREEVDAVVALLERHEPAFEPGAARRARRRTASGRR